MPACTSRPLLLRREDAANVLGVSARTLDKWVKDGLVKKLTVGSIGLFAFEDLRVRRQTSRRAERGVTDKRLSP